MILFHLENRHFWTRNCLLADSRGGACFSWQWPQPCFAWDRRIWGHNHLLQWKLSWLCKNDQPPNSGNKICCGISFLLLILFLYSYCVSALTPCVWGDRAYSGFSVCWGWESRTQCFFSVHPVPGMHKTQISFSTYWILGTWFYFSLPWPSAFPGMTASWQS